MTITKAHRAYFKAARAVSALSDFNRIHTGAVAVYGHKIISSGANSHKTNPTQKLYNRYRFEGDAGNHSLHAEIQCLLPLMNRKDIDFSKVSLYIYREHKNHTPGLSRPCPSCMQLIRDLGIRNIYYTGEGSYISENLIY